MMIVRSKQGDAKNLTDLTIRSKSYWDYGVIQMEAWRDELTITEKYLEDNYIHKLLVDDDLVGFYAYDFKNKVDIKLNYLFVEPTLIGKGYGRMLMFDFLKRIEDYDFKSVLVDADPHAETFYAKLGFRVIGKTKSSLTDRYLPKMALKKIDLRCISE